MSGPGFRQAGPRRKPGRPTPVAALALLLALATSACFLWRDDEPDVRPREVLLGSGVTDEPQEGPCERNKRRYRAGTVVCAKGAFECQPSGEWLRIGNC